MREGKEVAWMDWCRLLSTKYKDEALVTLKEEGLLQEAFMMFTIDDTYYTIGFSEGNHLPATEREVNRKHQQMKKECLIPIGPASLLYHFKA